MRSFIFSKGIAASFLRIVTNPKIFQQPSSISEAWEFLDVLSDRPEALIADVDDMTFGIFKHMSFLRNMGGNQIRDALLASLAIRHDAEFRTFDAGFSAYAGLNLTLLPVDRT